MTSVQTFCDRQLSDLKRFYAPHIGGSCRQQSALADDCRSVVDRYVCACDSQPPPQSRLRTDNHCCSLSVCSEHDADWESHQMIFALEMPTAEEFRHDGTGDLQTKKK